MGKIGGVSHLENNPKPAHRLPMTQPRIELRQLTRRLPSRDPELTILDHVDLAIDPGEFVAVLGPSGSGRWTLLALMSGIDRPTSGELRTVDDPDKPMC